MSAPVVDFQSGSRLTSSQLNAAVEQLLYATEELTVFGSSSSQATVDLSTESINNLGDVSLDLTNGGALLVVGQDGIVRDSTSGGFTGVLTVNGETGNVVLDNTDVGAAPTVHTHTMSDITDLSFTLGGNSDVTINTPADGEVLTYVSGMLVNRQSVTIASGTGAPPSSWTTDPNRLTTELYIRTG